MEYPRLSMRDYGTMLQVSLRISFCNGVYMSMRRKYNTPLIRILLINYQNLAARPGYRYLRLILERVVMEAIKIFCQKKYWKTLTIVLAIT